MKSGIRRILCIDDEDMVLDGTKAILEATGRYSVTCFNNGEEALKHVKSASPDLILLDMVMPGMDGIAVLEKLKKDRDTRSIPVIFMTAKKSPSDIKKYMDMGALSVIEKPIDVEDFPHQIEMISKILH